MNTFEESGKRNKVYSGIIVESVGESEETLHLYGSNLRDKYNAKLVEISREDRLLSDKVAHHWSDVPLLKSKLIKFIEGENE
jgi:hypothetical protein